MIVSGRWTRLRPLEPADAAWLYDTATSRAVASTWRLGGSTPSPADFGRFVSAGVVAQAVIESASSDERIGFVQLLDADWRNLTVELTVFLTPERWGDGWPLEAVVLAVDHAFDELGMRKVYLRMSRATVRRIARVVDVWLVEEARQAAHFSVPTSDDLVTLAIDRRGIEHEAIRRLLRRRPDPVPATPTQPVNEGAA